MNRLTCVELTSFIVQDPIQLSGENHAIPNPVDDPYHPIGKMAESMEPKKYAQGMSERDSYISL